MGIRSAYVAALCDIVLVCDDNPDKQPKVYVQNFAYDTKEALPPSVVMHLNEKHVQVFEDMRLFTAFLVDYPAVVDNCWVIR